MRSPLLSSLILATLLLAHPAHAQTRPTAMRPSNGGGQPAPKSAALTSKTPFKLDPFLVLRSEFFRVELGGPVATEAEMELLYDANDGKVDNWSMAKAALVVCGVEDPQEQQQYFAQLKMIERGCKEATANIRSSRARAEALGKFLLEGPMHAGYVSGQSNFVETLNTGTFNCVSSAIMYNIMAPRVGIQTRVVTISGHIYSRALDFDIEPTSGNVYSLDDRARRALKMQNVNESSIAPYKDKLFRETGNAGLIASLYRNMGIDHINNKRYAPALACFLKAACLDPGDPTTAYELRVTFDRFIKACKENRETKRAAYLQKFKDDLLRPYEDTALQVASK